MGRTVPQGILSRPFAGEGTSRRLVEGATKGTSVGWVRWV